MTIRSSREIMAWQPPAGWRELSGERRTAYLEQHGIQIPLRPADWNAMEHTQRMDYLAWHTRILYDTPEARSVKLREYHQELRGWSVLMCWWILCLLVALALVWGTGALGEGVGLRIGMTVFVLVGYTMAIFLPMSLTRPDPPRA
ncbi:hypothetical protein ABZV67_45665 [Streptomyces sp. NPDC005065]|uniref:hypothetical protein n=1 Tax=unclassified Streptomyces TaxID=2593676 RepID=UPI0033A8B409